MMGTNAERFPEKLTQISPKKCLRAAGDEAEDGLIHFKIEYSSLEYHHILYGGAIKHSKEEGLLLIITEFLRETHLSLGHDLTAALQCYCYVT